MKLCDYVAKTFLDEPGQCILEEGHPHGHVILPKGATLESVLAQVQERSRIDLQTRNTELVEQRRALQREVDCLKQELADLRATQYTKDLVVERQGRLHAENELEGVRKEVKRLTKELRYIAEFQAMKESSYRSWPGICGSLQSIAFNALRETPPSEVKELVGKDGWVLKQATTGDKNPWGDGCWHGDKAHPCALDELRETKSELNDVRELLQAWKKDYHKLYEEVVELRRK